MSISMTEKVYMRELTEQEMTEIYQSHLVEDFPAGEVKPLAHMLEGRKKGQYEAYGLFEKDTLKGYAYFIKNSTQPAALLDYFAIVRGLRSAGYGSLFLKKLQAMCIEQQKQLILEVENPDYVTVTVNDEFVESTDFATTALKENDVVEFLYFMGGGAN